MESIYLNLFKLMEMPHLLIYIGLLLLLSYAGGKIANYLKAPRVTGYLVIGMLMSPSLLEMGVNGDTAITGKIKVSNESKKNSRFFRKIKP